ncbi:MAG: hypothetical protein H3C47_14450 [Candidatus Cloacimonetes bacterium]|nr:hypothetical protein [Candidatus Cloacimonadota bacterium]
MDAKFFKVSGIIGSASFAAGAVGAGMAQAPGSDFIPLCVIQTAMIQSIGWVHGVKISDTHAPSLLANFSAAVAGRSASQLACGWFPGYGNAINGSTAASLTAAIGWAAHKFFQKGGD